MSFYPAVVVAVNPESTVVCIESTGKQIIFAQNAHNAIAEESRQVGRRGFISFPKAPPVFTAEKAEQVAA